MTKEENNRKVVIPGEVIINEAFMINKSVF